MADAMRRGLFLALAQEPLSPLIRELSYADSSCIDLFERDASGTTIRLTDKILALFYYLNQLLIKKAGIRRCRGIFSPGLDI